jgi:hypothetical protein
VSFLSIYDNGSSEINYDYMLFNRLEAQKNIDLLQQYGLNTNIYNITATDLWNWLEIVTNKTNN